MDGDILSDHQFMLRVMSERKKELENEGRDVDVPLHARLPL